MSQKRMLERLAEARPPGLEPAPNPARRHHDLTRAFAEPPATTRSRTVSHRRLLPAVVALGSATAAVTAAVIVVPHLASDPRPPTDHIVGSNQPSSADATNVPAELTARHVLLAASRAAERAAATSDGQIWHTRVESATVEPVVGADYLIEIRWRDEFWLDPAEDGQDAWVRTELGARPARPEDVAAWKRAGSAQEWTIEVPGPCPDLAQARSSPEGCTREAVVRASPGKPVTRPIGQFGGDALYALGDWNVSVQELAQLPSEPAQLKAKLLEGYDGCSAVACQDQQVPRDAWLFETASALVTDMPVTPRARAAAFRMLAELPGVSVHTDARDALGRAGIAVSVPAPAGNDKQPGQQEVRLLIDPDTWTGLAVEHRILTPDVERPWAEQDLRIHYSAVETTEWVDQRPDTSVAR